MKRKRKETATAKATKRKQKNISQKLHNPWQHENDTNPLIKLIRLMEVTGERHNFIRTGASGFVFWNLRFTKMLSLNKKLYH